MRDLGTLGGDWSTATAVDGDIVVGESDVAGGGYHAFAYDLGAQDPQLIDLGTLGGPYSTATAVDGNVVVGWTHLPGFEVQHAFAYDLGATTPRMRDLGTLGGHHGEANAVSGNIVVGEEQRAGDEGSRAFVYDLGATSPGMRDLGTFGGTWAAASAVDGTTVVGLATRKGDVGSRGFVYDLEDATPQLRDLGTLGGTSTTATAVDGRFVVGHATRAGDGAERVIAYDLGAATTPKIADLGPWGFDDYDNDEGRVAVSGSVVAGAIPVRGGTHAAVWRLSETTAPAFELSEVATAVQENSAKATVTVTRAGDSSPAVTVHYATTGVTASADKDFGPTSGTLAFASGQTQKSFTVPIVNDTVPERRETVLVTLSAPAGGAVLGTPNAAALEILASDQRPDAMISTRRASRYAGSNVYNATGRRQTKARPVRRGHWRSFYVRVQNDGNTTNSFSLRGSAARPGSQVRYSAGTSDLTASLLSAGGLKVTLRPRAMRLIRVQIKAETGAARRSRKVAYLRATWTGDATRADLVKAVARVRR